MQAYSPIQASGPHTHAYTERDIQTHLRFLVLVHLQTVINEKACHARMPLQLPRHERLPEVLIEHTCCACLLVSVCVLHTLVRYG